MTQRVLISNLSVMLGVADYRLRKLCDKKLIPFERVGVYRTFALADLDTIRAACVKAGFLTADRTEREPAHAG